jgi:hypothetical protein
LSRIPPSLAELPLRRKTPLLLSLYEFLLRAIFSKRFQTEALPKLASYQRTHQRRY